MHIKKTKSGVVLLLQIQKTWIDFQKCTEAEQHWAFQSWGKYSEKDRGDTWTRRSRIISYSLFWYVSTWKICHSFFGFSFKRKGGAFTEFFCKRTIFHYPCCCSLLLKHTVTDRVVPAGPNQIQLQMLFKTKKLVSRYFGLLLHLVNFYKYFMKYKLTHYLQVLIFESFVSMAGWFQVTLEIVYGTAATRTEEIQLAFFFLLLYFHICKYWKSVAVSTFSCWSASAVIFCCLLMRIW